MALGLLVGPAAAVAAADDEAQEEEAEREVAQIKIEIKLESGRVVKPDDNFTVDFGVENSLAIEADGSRHQFMLKVERKADASDEGEGKKKKDKKKDEGGIFSGPVPWIAGGVAIVATAAVVFFATRPSDDVSVGAPAWQ